MERCSSGKWPKSSSKSNVTSILHVVDCSDRFYDRGYSEMLVQVSFVVYGSDLMGIMVDSFR